MTKYFLNLTGKSNIFSEWSAKHLVIPIGIIVLLRNYRNMKTSRIFNLMDLFYLTGTSKNSESAKHHTNMN